MIRTLPRELSPNSESGGDPADVPTLSAFPSVSALLEAEPAPWQPLLSGSVQTKKAEDPTKGLKHLSDQQKQSLRSAVEQDTVDHTLQLLTRDWLSQPTSHGQHQAVWAGIRVRDAKNNNETLLVRIDSQGHESVTKVDNPDQVRKQETVDEAADALLPSLEQQVAAHPGQAARQAIKVDGHQYVVSLEPNGAERIEKTDNARATMAIDDEIDKLSLEMAATPAKQRHTLKETIKVGGDKWKVSLTPDGKASAEKQRGFWGSFLHVITSIVTPIVDVASFFCPALAPVAFGLNALSSGEEISEGNVLGGILGLAGTATSGLSALSDMGAVGSEFGQVGRIGSRVVAGTAGTLGVIQGAERGDVLGALGAAASGVGGGAFGSGSSIGRDLALGSSVAGAAEGNWQSALVGAGMLASNVGPLAGKQYGPTASQFWLGGSAETTPLTPNRGGAPAVSGSIPEDPAALLGDVLDNPLETALPSGTNPGSVLGLSSSNTGSSYSSRPENPAAPGDAPPDFTITHTEAANPPSHSFWGGLKAFGSGLYEGAVKPLVDTALHPIRTLQGLGYVVAHPVTTVKAAGQGIKQTAQGVWSGDLHTIGVAVGAIGSIFIPGAGEAELGEDAVRVGQAGKAAAEAAEEAEQAAQVAEAAEEAAQAERAALEEAEGATQAEPTTVQPGKLTGSLESLNADEQTMARELLASGHDVELVPTGPNRTPDFKVDGVPTELKTLSGVVNQTSDGLSSALSNRIMNGRGQADTILVDARQQPGMTLEVAERGMKRAYGADKVTGAKIESITVLTRDGAVTMRRP